MGEVRISTEEYNGLRDCYKEMQKIKLGAKVIRIEYVNTCHEMSFDKTNVVSDDDLDQFVDVHTELKIKGLNETIERLKSEIIKIKTKTPEEPRRRYTLWRG